MSTKAANGRVTRWLHVLSEFDCEIRDRKGKDNPVADYLSRPILYLTDTSRSKDVTFDEIKSFLNSETDAATDKTFRRIARRYYVHDGILFWKNKEGLKKVIFTLKDLHKILSDLHENSGHLGFKSVWKIVKERFYRPHLYQEVEHYVNSCVQCQEFRIRKPNYKFTGKEYISGIFNTWGGDFLGPLPVSAKGNRYICVFVEYLTGYIFAEAVPDQTSVSALKILRNLISLFGVPLRLTLDQGSAFIADNFKSFCSLKSIEPNYVLSYQPEWNGLAENANSLIRYGLTKLCYQNFENRDSYLPEVLYGTRIRIHSRTGYSP
jgi:hypothetical protein